jgi:hypothetical protein
VTKTLEAEVDPLERQHDPKGKLKLADYRNEELEYNNTQASIGHMPFSKVLISIFPN